MRMRKWVIAGIALAAVFVAILVAALNVNSIIKRNREYLLARAAEATGRKISAGDIELTLWGGVGLRIDDLAIADDARFSTGDFVRARAAQVHLKLLPLFRKKFEIKNVVLRDPAITIIRNAAGAFNFDSIGGGEKEKTEKQDRKREKRSDRGEIRIAPVDIVNGALVYRDEKQATELRLKQIDLKVQDGGSAKPASIALQAAAFGNRRNLKVDIRLGPIQQAGDWRRAPMDGEISFDPLDLAQLRAAAPGVWSVLPKELSAAGMLGVNNLRLKGTLDNLTFKGVVNGTSAAITFGSAFRKASGVPFEIAADGGYAKETLRLAKADIKLDGLEATVKGVVNFGSAPAVDLSLNSRPSSLTGLGKTFPVLEGYQLSGNVEAHTTMQGKIAKGVAPAMQGELMLSGVGAAPPQFPRPIKDLNAKVVFSGRRAVVKDGSATLGSAKIRWSGAVETFTPLTASYALSTVELRPADFQSAPAEERRGDVLKNFTSEGSLTTQAGGLALQGKVGSSDGILYKIPYQRLDAGLAMSDKVINVRGLRMNAFRGVLFADGEYLLAEVPRFAITSKLQGIDISEGYRAFNAEAQRDIQGRLTADIKLAGSGRSWDEIKSNMRGQGDADVAEGALLNFNLVDAALSGVGIPGAKNFINPQVRKKYPETFEAKDTKFKQLKTRFDVAAGRIQFKDMQVTAADYSAQGDGWADFDHRVEFKAVLVLSRRLSGDLAQSAREVKFLFNEQNEFQMPFTVSGRLPNVKTRPDPNYLAKALQRGFVGQGVEQLERRLFGRKESPPATNDDQPAEESEKRKKRKPEDLIRRGLEGLFKR
jgi:uncharacterized protein involved in outer membrane biogenesis